MDIWKTLIELPRSRQCWSVVRINSQEKIGVFVAPHRQIVFDHVADHLVLLPKRHEYGDALFGSASQLPLSREMEAPIAKNFCQEPSIEVYKVDEEVVQTAQ